MKPTVAKRNLIRRLAKASQALDLAQKRRDRAVDDVMRLQERLTQSMPPEITDMIEHARKTCGVDVSDIRRRTERSVWSRNFCCYFLRQKGWTYYEIAAALPWMPDHATVIHAVKRHRELCVGAKGYKALYDGFVHTCNF